MKKTQIEQRHNNQAPIDWDEVKNKISAWQDLFNNKMIIPPEERRSILKARAQVLAVEKKLEIAQKEFIEIVVFNLAAETYGIESKFVREVYPLKDFTTLPGLPDFVLGIVNIRGQIISVIDLKKFFNLPESGIGELNKVIVIRNEKMEFGILADTIEGTRSILLNEIQGSPVSTTGIGADYLKAITIDRIIIIDALRILEDEKIIINQETD